MRSLIVAAVLVGTAFGLSADDKPVITQAFVDQLNAVEGKTWTASADNGIITGANLRQIKRLLGTRDIAIPKDYPMRVFTEEEKLKAIPEEFDSAKNWPNCTTITHIADQSDCGSCWAVGAASAISDRLCTAGSNKRVQFVSARDLLSCCWTCGNGCYGGIPSAAWSWWVSNGLVAEECQPYPFPKCNHHSDGPYPPCGQRNYPTPDCIKTCDGNANGTSMERIKGKFSYAVWSEVDYQNELMAHGPFEVAFTVYDDFLAYKSGVYQHTTGYRLGGHAVRLVGWGVLDGVKYWKIANSWNDNWGMNGYFLIKRGTNECGIERSGIAGLPQ